MKRAIFISFLAIIGLLFVLSAFRSATEKPATNQERFGIVYGHGDLLSPETSAELSALLESSSNPIYQTPETSDTITDAENDTLSVSPNLISFWTYNHTIDITSLSGSVSIIAILQENNERTGGTWYEVERDTATGAGQLRLHGADTPSGLGYVKGIRQRLILDGSGTQSTKYTKNSTYKKE